MADFDSKRNHMSSNKLLGKVALVTGGSSGIGLATAQRFSAEGARVFITGRRQTELDAAVKTFGNGTAIQADSSKLADLDRVYATIKKDAGKLDILFANAGSGTFAPLGQITEADFDETFGVNVKGLLFTVQKALPLLVDGSSVILNASIVATMGVPALSVYSATKAAVRNFARSWIRDLAARKIRVNVVSPGPIETPGITKIAGSAEAAQDFMAQMTPEIPMGRVGQPEEIAAVVLFLASDASSLLTGSIILADAGYTCW